MNWRASLSDKEVKEMTDETCEAYQTGFMMYPEFLRTLAALGYNATDIADLEKQFRPAQAPESEDEGED